MTWGTPKYCVRGPEKEKCGMDNPKIMCRGPLEGQMCTGGLPNIDSWLCLAHFRTTMKIISIISDYGTWKHTVKTHG